MIGGPTMLATARALTAALALAAKKSANTLAFPQDFPWRSATAMDEGGPVQGCIQWSLPDNYARIMGYKPEFGLGLVDRTGFRRTTKLSAAVLGGIARCNSL